MSKPTGFGAIFGCIIVASCTAGPVVRSGQSCGESTGIPDTPLLIFGELHGTNEAPGLVARHVCAIAWDGHPVVVGLEIDSDEQHRLDAYLAGEGQPFDRRNLLGGTFWQKPEQDGRSSTAMFGLVESLRVLKAGGGNIRVLAIDQAKDEETRDASMASAIRSATSDDQARRVVVLVGNHHAGKTGGGNVASLLADVSPTTVLIAYRSGTAWTCGIGGACGVEQISSAWAIGRRAGFHPLASPLPGYDGTYLLDSISASPPAKDGSH